MAASPRVFEDVEGIVRAILGRVANREPGWRGDADIFRELGVKSAAALDLLLSLEEELGVAIADEAFSEARTTDAIVTLVHGLLGAEVR